MLSVTTDESVRVIKGWDVTPPAVGCQQHTIVLSYQIFIFLSESDSDVDLLTLF